MSDPLDGLVEDKQKKTAILKRVIAETAATSTADLFQKIHNVINNDGGKIEAIILSGGYTNYSYKVFVQGQPDLAVFAKLSFEYALWNPDKVSNLCISKQVPICIPWIPNLINFAFIYFRIPIMTSKEPSVSMKS